MRALDAAIATAARNALVLLRKGRRGPDGLRRFVLEAERLRLSISRGPRQGADTLRIEAPRLVLELSRDPGIARVTAFSRGDWEGVLASAGGVPLAAAAGGATWYRKQRDPLLLRMLAERGLEKVPMFTRRSEGAMALGRRTAQTRALRDGPLGPQRSSRTPAEHARLVKTGARKAGATLAGIARLAPEMVRMGETLEHDWVIGLAIKEDYADALRGPQALEEGAHRAYELGARVATGLARAIREELGYPAVAHHIAKSEIVMLPALHAAGLGELGRHGSLIHPQLGASWRGCAVTTTLPLVGDAPLHFGVQDYCLSCKLCERACPGEAIAPAGDFIATQGIRRWLVETEKCYPFSRLASDYCHICVDVCPYVHKENGDAGLRQLYRRYFEGRKAQDPEAAES